MYIHIIHIYIIYTIYIIYYIIICLEYHTYNIYISTVFLCKSFLSPFHSSNLSKVDAPGP